MTTPNTWSEGQSEGESQNTYPSPPQESNRYTRREYEYEEDYSRHRDCEIPGGGGAPREKELPHTFHAVGGVIRGLHVHASVPIGSPENSRDRHRRREEPLEAAGGPIPSRRSYGSAQPSFPGATRGNSAYSTLNHPGTPIGRDGNAPAIVTSTTKW